jgi:hypothetical protein
MLPGLPLLSDKSPKPLMPFEEHLGPPSLKEVPGPYPPSHEWLRHIPTIKPPVVFGQIGSKIVELVKASWASPGSEPPCEVKGKRFDRKKARDAVKSDITVFGQFARPLFLLTDIDKII